MELKKISDKYIPEALKKAEKYRMLNHPKTSESICRDILEVSPGNQDAISLLIVAITGQFSNPAKYPDTKLKHAQEWVKEIKDEYHKLYFSGLILERWAKAKVQDLPGGDLYEYFREAIEFYEKAIPLAPEGDESAVLHYNFSLRFIDRHPHIRPSIHHDDASMAHNYGDSFHH